MEKITTVKKFLDYLGVKEKPATLEYLNELILAHQKRVRWETWTKCIDFEERSKKELYLPSIEAYVDRVVSQGTGGTCWTLARGFHYLLDALGFKVDYMYMEPGHLCLQVFLDQPYYVDIGYCAPLFKAYPLHTSFVEENEVEIFHYEIQDKNILVTRDPGPTKTLRPHAVSFKDVEQPLLNSHNWEDGFAFHSLRIFGYVEDVPYQLKGNVLRRLAQRNVVEEELTDEQVRFWIEEKFVADYSVYEKACVIFQKRKGS